MIKLARALGFEVRDGGKHIKIMQAGQLVAVLPRSKGSRSRNLSNIRSALARAAREED